jgi:hypothetical protein
MGKTLFHYTPVCNAVMILRSGIIRCSRKRRSTDPPPHVWLSSNPTDEPTACRLSSEQARQRGGRILFAVEGRVRFVFRGSNAAPWADLPLTPDVRRDLELKAKRKGGRSKDWFALPYDVPCGDLPLEIEAAGGWEDITHDDFLRQYGDITLKMRSAS